MKTKQEVKTCEDCGKQTRFVKGAREGHLRCQGCYIRHKSNQNKQTVVTKKIETTETPKTVSIDVSADMKRFIPKTDGYIARRICGTTDLAILEKAHKEKHFVLITGETGTGKTHLIRHFAYKKKLPYARVNLNGGTTADELIGHWIPDTEGKFKWQDGLLTLFVRNGGILVLDEVNACPAEILFCLHSLTDDERTLTLLDKDGEVIRANKNFFLVATMNPDYEGTKPLNEAFKDRFKVKLFFDYDNKIEQKLIEDEEVLKLAEKLRVMKNKGEISAPISTRMLIYYRENAEFYGEKLAFDMFLNNFELHEREPIKNVAEMIAKGEDTQIEEKQETDEEEEK